MLVSAAWRGALVGAVVSVLLAGCGGPDRPDSGRPLDPAAVAADHQRILDELDAAKAVLADRTVPPGERWTALRTLHRRLEDWAPQVANAGKAENHVLFHLAWCRFELEAERGGTGVLAALDRIDASRSTAFLGHGRLLRLRTLLRRGERSAAERLAPELEALMPELGPVARAWLRFHALVGGTAPAATGRRLHAGEPAPPGAWRLWVFTGTFDADALAITERALAAAGARLRVSIVTFDGSPLALAPFQRLPGADRAELWWAGAADQSAAVAAAWRLPELSSVLCTPDGTVVAVDLTPALASAMAEGRFVR